MAVSNPPQSLQNTRLSLLGAVNRFIQKVEPNLVQNGQFIWSFHYRNELTKLVNAALANDANLNSIWVRTTNLQNVNPKDPTPQTGVLSTLLRTAKDPLVSPGKFSQLLAEVLALQVRAGLTSPSASIIKGLLTLPGTPGQPNAATAVHNEATKLLKSGTIAVPGTTVTPGTTAFQKIFAPTRITFKGAQVMSTLARSRCFETTNAVCLFLKATGGFNGKAKDLNNQTNPGQIFQSILKRPPPLHDLLAFSSALPSAIKKARRAIDGGHVLNTGVVSGITLGNTLASPDHFVPILAYEEFLAPIPVVVFAFWDPDVTSSNLLGPAFGKLFFLDASEAEKQRQTGPNATTIRAGFYGNGRLTTAQTDIDLQCDSSGFDSRGQHRYQATVLDGQLRL